MAQSHTVLPIKPPTASSPLKAQPDREWGQLMQETAAAAPALDADPGAGIETHEQFDLHSQARSLQAEIGRMTAEYRALSQAAGENEAHQHAKINALMSMIAALSGTMTSSRAGGSQELRQAYGMMSSLQARLEAERAHSEREGLVARISLGQMHGMQSSLEQALSQILQQLSALQMRMGSLI